MFRPSDAARVMATAVIDVMKIAIEKCRQKQVVDWESVEKEVANNTRIRCKRYKPIVRFSVLTILQDDPVTFQFVRSAYEADPRVLVSIMCNTDIDHSVLTDSHGVFGGDSLIGMVAKQQDEAFVTAIIPRECPDYTKHAMLMRSVFDSLCNEFLCSSHLFIRGLSIIFAWLARHEDKEDYTRFCLRRDMWFNSALAISLAEIEDDDLHRMFVPLVQYMQHCSIPDEVMAAWLEIKPVRDAIVDLLLADREMFRACRSAPACARVVEEARMRSMMAGLCQGGNILCDELTEQWICDMRVLRHVADFARQSPVSDVLPGIIVALPDGEDNENEAYERGMSDDDEDDEEDEFY